MRHLVVLLIALGCRKAAVEVRPDDKTAPKRATCALVEPLGAATIAAHCDVTIDKELRVPAGASLDIGPGARITFTKGAGLVFTGGVLRARGTAERPIVFTSASATPGAWSGLVFYPRPPAEKTDAPPPASASILEHVVVEYGGAFVDGAVTYRAATGSIWVSWLYDDTVSLSHVKVRSSAGDALHLEHDGCISKLEHVDVENGRAVVPFDLVTALATAKAGVVGVHGKATRSVSLPKRTYEFASNVGVAATATPVTVEIASGSTVRFAKDAVMFIHGSAAPARLVASGVLFTSAAEKPAPGDWQGLSFSGDVSAEIDGATFEFAGGSTSGVTAAIALPADDTKMKIVSTVFRNHRGAAFESFAHCTAWESPALKNIASGALCDAGPVPPPAKVLMPPPLMKPIPANVPNTIYEEEAPPIIDNTPGGVAGGVAGGLPGGTGKLTPK